ncbi:hypothetical protein ADK86_30515 [Streptomyces sp. NRRL F-5755]|nr:hypothetical protein ADK86_30515 [Streptomyces sp. NRRL F-5755]
MAVASPLLVGTAPAAVAADTPAIDNTKVYTSEDDIVAAMEGTKDKPGYAPVEKSESVMGYPQGLDRDNPVTLDDVQPTYDPKDAVADAKEAAKAYASNGDNPAPLKKVAQQMADSKATEPEARKDINDDKTYPYLTGGPAKEYCEGKSADASKTQNAEKANPCVFVGKLDTKPGSKYPKAGGSSGLAGGGKKTFMTKGEAVDEKSTTTGWKMGGKFTPKLTVTPPGDKGGTGGEVGGEVSFEYSYSSTTLNRVTSTQEDKSEVDFPSDKKGSIQGRRDGAYYVGYIVVHRHTDKTEPNPDKDQLITIPARVYVQSPKSSTSVTYFKLQE